MAQQSIPQMLLDGGIHENDKEIDQLPHLKMVILITYLFFRKNLLDGDF